MYNVSGVITGNYAKPVNIRVYEINTGILLGEQLGVTLSYSVDVASNEPCTVVLTPEIGYVWRPNQYRALGDLIYPTYSSITPYYYECVGAGNGGQFEPVFTDNEFHTTQDRQVEWRRVERIPFPLIHSPVLPVLN